MIGVGRQRFLAGPHLQRERALCGLGKHLVGLEPEADLRCEPEPVEAACRQHDRVEPTFAHLPQAGLDVASERLDAQRRLEREQLRTSPRGGGPDPHLRANRRRPDQRVARIVALEVRADDEPAGVGRRQVLGRVNREVDATLKQRLLDLLHEHSTLADLSERPGAVAVAGGRDRDESDLDARAAQGGGSLFGLREREPRSA
jgi:hypothetical protein